MSVAELHRSLQNQPRPLLLDTRAQEEFDVSHLNGANWAPDLQSALKRLAAHAGVSSVVVYCSVGWRSSVLAGQLLQNGCAHVFNLEGSIFEWANSGLPVYRDGGVAKQVHPYNAHWGALLLSQLRSPI